MPSRTVDQAELIQFLDAPAQEETTWQRTFDFAGGADEPAQRKVERGTLHLGPDIAAYLYRIFTAEGNLVPQRGGDAVLGTIEYGGEAGADSRTNLKKIRLSLSLQSPKVRGTNAHFSRTMTRRELRKLLAS